MSWISKTLGSAAVIASVAMPSLAAHPQATRHARIVVSRPIIVRPRSYVYYPPVSYGYYPTPFYARNYYPYYSYGPAYPLGTATGEIRIDSHVRDANVFVDGAYVGPLRNFKRFGLRPGAHDVELRDAAGGVVFNQRVQVIVDRMVEIRSPI